MVFWILFLALFAACLTLALLLIDTRYRFHWERLSLQARLRRSGESADAAHAILARLRGDRDTGKLVINDDYTKLFDKLTQEASGE